ncbi:BnaA06g25310D [Brassica napus]|uniref:(rape) hypothetical protein n=1 Tax=Brassica napus TaxID=3708 RepID=A0A078GUK4_BRANA|nr:unnamed protein product [Brassica napus]CDY29226.1 BnaA06g25310D [Brassica napus]
MKSRQLQPTAYEETVDNIAPHDQRLKEVLRQRLCFVCASEDSEMISSVSDFFNQVRSSQTVHIFIDLCLDCYFVCCLYVFCIQRLTKDKILPLVVIVLLNLECLGFVLIL